MRMIFEPNIESVDYLELILTEEELEILARKGVISEFPFAINDNRNLNVYIRKETTRSKHATS
jgi:hypothetical protein